MIVPKVYFSFHSFFGSRNFCYSISLLVTLSKMHWILWQTNVHSYVKSMRSKLIYSFNKFLKLNFCTVKAKTIQSSLSIVQVWRQPFWIGFKFCSAKDKMEMLHCSSCTTPNCRLCKASIVKLLNTEGSSVV